jgi:hypothetical protein
MYCGCGLDGRNECRIGKFRTDRYRITDFISFILIDFEPGLLLGLQRASCTFTMTAPRP